MTSLDDVTYQQASLEDQPWACTADTVCHEESFYIPAYSDDTFAYGNDTFAYSNKTIDEAFKDFFSWASFSSFYLELPDGIPWDPDFDSMVDLDQYSN
ncbi:hypothetical protein ACKVV1_011384 [Pyricularia oryzae]